MTASFFLFVFLFFKKNCIFYWSRVGLQCCVSFRCTASDPVIHIHISILFQILEACFKAVLGQVWHCLYFRGGFTPLLNCELSGDSPECSSCSIHSGWLKVGHLPALGELWGYLADKSHAILFSASETFTLLHDPFSIPQD